MKNKIAKNEKIRYIIRFIKNINKKDVVVDMNHIYENPNSFFVEHCGDENIGKLVIPLIVDQRDDGFWAIMRRVLAGLLYAENNGMTPTVEFSLNVPYAEDPGYLGTDNPFEYFFMPILSGDWRKSRAIVKTKGFSKDFCGDRLFVAFENIEKQFGSDYWMSDAYIDCQAAMWKKYIRFNATTEETVCNTKVVEEIKRNNTIGVHVRGTDFNNGLKGHPVCVYDSEHIKILKELIDQNKYDRVFLATDEQKVVDDFKSEFGNCLILYDDILRSTDKNPVHLTEAKRANHNYLLGLEILKDTYALAQCKGLVCGMSQVINGVRILKHVQGETFDDIILINRGINK